MAFSDCNHYIKTPLVYKSSEVSRSEVKGFKLFGLMKAQGCLTRWTWRFRRRFRTRMDILVRPSSLGGHLCVKIFLPFFFFTLGNFGEADVSNVDPRWRRARADGFAHLYPSTPTRTRLGMPSPICVRPQALPPAHIRLQTKWLPVERMGLCTGIAVV